MTRTLPHYLKKTHVLLIAIFCVTISYSSFSATKTWYGNVNSDWNNKKNWNGNTLPSNGDDILIDPNSFAYINAPVISSNSSFVPARIDIKNGGLLTIQANLTTSDRFSIRNSSSTVNMTSGTLTINNGKDIRVDRGGEFNLSGGIINISGKLSIRNKGATYSIFNMTNGTLNANGNIELDGKGNPGNTPTFNLNGGTVNLSGNFRWINNSPDTEYPHLIVTGGTLNINGNLQRDASTFSIITIDISGGSIIMNGNLVMNATTDRINQTGGIIQFNNTKTWTNAGVYNATGGTVIFNGTTTLANATGSWQFYNLLINPAKTLDQNTPPNINISADWTNNGTFIPNTHTVTFNGSIAQNINGTTTFNSLEINNSFPATAVTLNSPVNVNSTFTLTDGHVITDAVNILTLNSNTSVVTPAGRSQQDSAFVKGPMVNVVATTSPTTKYFPVGKNNISHYAELNVTQGSSTTTDYTGEYINSSATGLGWSLPPTITKVSDIGYWNIDKSMGANVTNASVNLYFSGTYDAVTDPSFLAVAKGNPNAWIDLGGNIIYDGLGTPIGISSTVNFTTFSKFSLANGTGGTNPLPVSLINFEAIPSSGDVNLKWATASEINNSFFTIEKSTDATEFIPISILEGSGNTNQTTQYSITDKNAFNDGKVLYYRLRQTDFNGKNTISNIVSVSLPQENTSRLNFNLYPNPINRYESVNIRINDFQPQTEVLVVVKNLLGQDLYSKVIMTDFNGNSINAIDPENNLPPGTYLIIGTSMNQIFNKYLIIR